LKASPAV